MSSIAPIQPILKPAYVDPDLPVFPISVAFYHDLIDRGLLKDGDPVELIEGVLVFQMPTKPPHVLAVEQVAEAIRSLLPPEWFYRTEKPITLSDGEPEPDGMIVRGRIRDYGGRHPGPSDVTLVIEVSDSTLTLDRGSKLRSYARAGVERYWIVNLVERTIETHSIPLSTEPTPRYASRQDFGEADAVPVSIDGVTVGAIAVTEVLP